MDRRLGHSVSDLLVIDDDLKSGVRAGREVEYLVFSRDTTGESDLQQVRERARLP